VTRRTLATIDRETMSMPRRFAVSCLAVLLAGCAAAPRQPTLQARTPAPTPIERPAAIAAAPLPDAMAPSEPVFPPVDDGADIPERRIDASTAPEEVLARIAAGDGDTVAVRRPGVGNRCRIQFVTGAATGVRANPLDCLDSGFASVRGARIDGRDVVVTDGEGRDVARLTLGGGFFAWTPAELAPRLAPGR
jgi:hypothetical protein